MSWKNEGQRHSLASRGIKSKASMDYKQNKSIKWKRIINNDLQKIIDNSDLIYSEGKYGWYVDNKLFVVTKYFEPENSSYMAYNTWTGEKQKDGTYKFDVLGEYYGIKELKHAIELNKDKDITGLSTERGWMK